MSKLMIGLFEYIKKDLFEGLVENEFGEEWEALDSDHPAYKLVEDILNKIPKQPDTKFEPGKISDVVKVKKAYYEDQPHYIAIIDGGQNGNGKWKVYLEQIKAIFDGLNKSGRAWLVDLSNDCLDDVWRLRIAFRLKD